ncbi:MAG: HEAT repeat domain-containing protein [Gemmataceae bacterium]
MFLFVAALIGFQDPSARDGELVRMIQRGDVETRRRAAAELQVSDAKHLPELIDCYRKDADPQVRTALAYFFGQLGPAAKDAVPHLLKDAKAEDVELRRRVTWALGYIGSESDRVIPVLIEAMEDPDPGTKTKVRVSVMAITSFYKHGEQARSAVPALLTSLDKRFDNLAIRCAIVGALGMIGGDDPRVIPKLISCLDEKLDERTQILAAGALGSFGPKAESALPRLEQMLLHRASSPNLRDTVLRALEKIGLDKLGAEAVKEIGVLAADNKIGNVCEWTATRALGRVNKKHAAIALPVLLRALETGKRDASTSIVAWGSDALPALMPMITDTRDLALQEQIMRILVAMGPAAKDARPAIERALRNSTNERIIALARKALQNTEPE